VLAQLRGRLMIDHRGRSVFAFVSDFVQVDIGERHHLPFSELKNVACVHEPRWNRRAGLREDDPREQYAVLNDHGDDPELGAVKALVDTQQRRLIVVVRELRANED
jgi:hypothetical protein